MIADREEKWWAVGRGEESLGWARDLSAVRVHWIIFSYEEVGTIVPLRRDKPLLLLVKIRLHGPSHGLIGQDIYGTANINVKFIQAIRNNGTRCTCNSKPTSVCYLFAMASLLLVLWSRW